MRDRLLLIPSHAVRDTAILVIATCAFVLALSFVFAVVVAAFAAAAVVVCPRRR